MKYYFIVNPMSGTKGMRHHFFEGLEQLEVDYKMLTTQQSGDGTVYARDICEAAMEAGDSARIFACGGDGTINEVVNGCVGFDNVEVGAIPFGTGNDFVRNFGDKAEYLDVVNYVTGPSVECDLIGYQASFNGENREGVCVNMVNIGLDCKIADNASTMKNIPLVSGSLSYLLSVVYNMIEKKGADLNIEYSNGEVYNNKLLLISIANGCYCGGGIKGLPLALTNDGIIDTSLVKFISRRDFLRVFPMYSKGTHLDSKFVQTHDVIDYKKVTGLTITSNDGPAKLCVDGEISKFDSISFAIKEKAFRFIVPAGAGDNGLE